jgi:hypothetical protein
LVYKHGRRRPETIYFLGFTLYCTRNQKGNFKVGMRTEKSRLRRSLTSLRDLMRRIRHLTIQEQVNNLNNVLRGHYAYYGIAGNIRALQKVHRAVERYWRKMLCTRSWAGCVTWACFTQDTDPVAATKAVPPLPGATGSRSAVNQLPKSVVREICTLRSVGAGGGRLPPLPNPSDIIPGNKY